MKSEYINRRVVSRQRLIIKLTAVLLALLLYFFFRYYFAPEDVQSGLRSSRRWHSWNQFLIFSCFAILILVPFMFWSRIILRISISVPENRLSIALIDRFRWTARTKEVLLSQTQIQTEYVDETNCPLLRKSSEYYVVRLINPVFGTLTISEWDFDDIREIVHHFDHIREDTAKNLRRRRLSRRR